MPSENLLSYISPDPAVDDLDAGLVDLVIMDRKPAENFARQGKAKVVGHGLNPQSFAIAVRKGSSLLPEINSGIGRDGCRRDIGPSHRDVLARACSGRSARVAPSGPYGYSYAGVASHASAVHRRHGLGG